jgi:catechol 2,3-dioxygenase
MLLPDSTQLGPVTLAVSDLDRSLSFYRDLVGLFVLEGRGSQATLGVGDTAVIQLVEEAGAKPAHRYTTGLYHVAILYPDRAALARVVRHMASQGYPFTGASDHLVSEAFYLDDADGLGVELYRDRPRAEWNWSGDTIEMATRPLDVNELLSEATRPFDGAPDGTRLGHVHLKVGDIAQAEAFYRDVLGFSVTTHLGESATFLAAGGYHHHIGANVWESRGAGPAPAGHTGLREIVIEASGIDARELVDPWGLHVRVRPATARPS